MFWWRQTVSDGRHRVDCAFTDNRDGVSTGACGGLNLGGHVGDDPSSVRRNRDLVADAVGAPGGRLVMMRQVHGRDVRVVTDPAQDVGDCDGVVTTLTGVTLAVLVADCTPVLLADPDAGVVAAVHAGRPGMMRGVVASALETMSDLGARRIRAVVGPSVCGRCYEVEAELQEEAAAVSPASRAVSWTGTPAIDVAAGVVEQLHAHQVAVTWVPGCTRESTRLYSYRRDHGTGRQAGLITLRP